MARSSSSFVPRPVTAPAGSSSRQFARPVDRSWTEADNRRFRIQDGHRAAHSPSEEDELPVNHQSDFGHIDHRLTVMLNGVANGLNYESRYHKLTIYSFVLGAHRAVQGQAKFSAEIGQLAKECLEDRLHHMRPHDVGRFVTHELTPSQATAIMSQILGLWGDKIGTRALKKVRRLQDGYQSTQQKIRPPLLVGQLADALMS